LGRASSVVKESFSNIDTPSDSAEAVKLLKTLLQGVEMTEKQLSEVECSTLCCIYLNSKVTAYCSVFSFFSFLYLRFIPHSFSAIFLVPYLNTFV